MVTNIGHFLPVAPSRKSPNYLKKTCNCNCCCFRRNYANFSIFLTFLYIWQMFSIKFFLSFCKKKFPFVPVCWLSTVRPAGKNNTSLQMEKFAYRAGKLRSDHRWSLETILMPDANWHTWSCLEASTDEDLWAYEPTIQYDWLLSERTHKGKQDLLHGSPKVASSSGNQRTSWKGLGVSKVLQPYCSHR